MISYASAPSNTGVATLTGPDCRGKFGRSLIHSGSPWMSQPREAAQPRCSSMTWPRFMRPGTPSGFSTMSTGVPSARNGMSSSGRIFEMTPLLPWRPAILSPSVILRFCAT